MTYTPIDISKAAQILRENDDFLILSHANPDGDTLGCAYALCGILQKAGKRAKTLCADELVSRMEYLRETVIQQEFEEKTVVSVDVADLSLLGSLKERFEDRILLAIDHHESHRPFAENYLVDPDAAAACEIIYEIAVKMGVPLDEKIAACLYTGISTDTGCFRYANTTPKTHMIAAKLLEYKFAYHEINYSLFDLKSRGRLEIERLLIENMKYYSGGKIAVAYITSDILGKCEHEIDTEDINGLSSLPRRIEGVLLGVTVKQKGPELFKISVRTAGCINAAELCAKFGGGGHARAAGCTIEGSLEKVNAQLIPVLEQEIEKL